MIWTKTHLFWIRASTHAHQRAFLGQSIPLELLQLITFYWWVLKVSSAFSIETFSEIWWIFLKQHYKELHFKRNSRDCEALLRVLKTFLLLAVGIITNTRIMLICSREGFDPMFAVTDVCLKKEPCCSQWRTCFFPIRNAIELTGPRLSKMHMQIVCWFGAKAWKS